MIWVDSRRCIYMRLLLCHFALVSGKSWIDHIICVRPEQLLCGYCDVRLWQ